MGMTPELAIALLACARIGAVHSVIFGGFAANAIADRVATTAAASPSSPRTPATAAATKSSSSRPSTRPCPPAPPVKHVVVYRRTGSP
jgi:acetyl-CoA synthetase